jgi:hypothetical protein
MTRKYFGRNVVRENRKKDRWQEALLVSYFLAACRRGGLCCEKNGYFYIILEISLSC